MKKLFFSAVALFAFSSVSMANTIAENETSSFELKALKDKHEFCVNVAADVLCEIDPYDLMTDVEAHDMYQIAYEICMKS
jgi:hypothetical protein